MQHQSGDYVPTPPSGSETIMQAPGGSQRPEFVIFFRCPELFQPSHRRKGQSGSVSDVSPAVRKNKVAYEVSFLTNGYTNSTQLRVMARTGPLTVFQIVEELFNRNRS